MSITIERRTKKYCPDCDTVRPVSEFGKNSGRPDGLRGYCKSCHTARARVYRKEFPEKVKATLKSYYNANREKWKVYKSERIKRMGGHGHRRNLEALLVDHDWTCGICDMPLPEDRNLIHVDHIIPVSKGGGSNIENLQPFHAVCNIRKGDSC